VAAVCAALTVSLPTENFRDLRHGQTRVDHLLDPPRTLGVGEIALVIIGYHLVHDPVDRFGGAISGRGGQHVDRHGAQTELAGSHDAPLPVADLHRTVAANRGQRHQDTVFGDAVQERLVQVRIFAHVLAEDQAGRIEMLQGAAERSLGVFLVVGAVLGFGGDRVGHCTTFRRGVAARSVCLLALEIWAGIRAVKCKVRAQSFPCERSERKSLRALGPEAQRRPWPCAQRTAGHNRRARRQTNHVGPAGPDTSSCRDAVKIDKRVLIV
jgi:hypothetical protein